MVMRSISYILVVFLSAVLPSFNEKKIEGNRIETVNGSYISFSEMDKFLHSQMDSMGLPGLSIAIINDSKIIYYRTFGVTNIAVSYTHLRAHETDSYLVCRLLLEK